MAESFRNKIRLGQLKSPQQRGFDVEEWEKNWRQSKRTERCNQLYQAGFVFDRVFQEIRDSLSELYKDGSPIPDKQLLKSYVALSNRDSTILSRSLPSLAESGSLFSASVASQFGDQISAEELAQTCVDGLEKAISNTITRIDGGDKPGSKVEGENPLNFLIKEANLSQLYDMLEGLWNALLWADYEFSGWDEAEGFVLTQLPTPEETGFLSSHIRRSRLVVQNTRNVLSGDVARYFDEDRYFEQIRRGRKKVLVTKNVGSSELVRALNAEWRVAELNLADDFPEELLEEPAPGGFSIKQCLDVFRALMLFSNIAREGFPQDDSFYTDSKLQLFCPSVNRVDLARALSRITQTSFRSVSGILQFLEFDTGARCDLWCHPLIKIDSNYLILTSVFSSPNQIRLVEHWVVSLGLDLSKKGLSFETTAQSLLNESLRRSDYSSDYDKAASGRFKFDSEEEEIDLLCRFGSTILLGEAKSVVTTDSPYARHTTIQTLKGAVAQVQRKAGFLKRNLSQILEELDWSTDASDELNIVGFVLISSRVYSGCSFDGIPVVDSKILCRYFENNTVPLFSTIDQTTGKSIDHAWHVLYEDRDSFEANFELYLNNPPQLSERSDEFDLHDLRLPTISEDSPKILYRRLVARDVSPNALLDRAGVFPLVMTDDIDKVLDEIDVVV